MRGVSLVSFIGVGVSALKSCAPPTPSSGRTATASTTTPMPPIQMSCARQRLIDAGTRSRFDRTVPPEAVKPDTVSK